jgi:hypothetical protein
MFNSITQKLPISMLSCSGRAIVYRKFSSSTNHESHILEDRKDV